MHLEDQSHGNIGFLHFWRQSTAWGTFGPRLSSSGVTGRGFEESRALLHGDSYPRDRRASNATLLLSFRSPRSACREGRSGCKAAPRSAQERNSNSAGSSEYIFSVTGMFWGQPGAEQCLDFPRQTQVSAAPRLPRFPKGTRGAFAKPPDRSGGQEVYARNLGLRLSGSRPRQDSRGRYFEREAF